MASAILSDTAPAATATSTRALRRLASLVFVQMLCATMIAPSIRPLFALHHGGREGPMHAFMGVNMLGAIAGALWVGRLLARGRPAHRLLSVLAGLDALLLVGVALPLPTGVVLALRAVEGLAHVGAATALVVTMAGDRATTDRRRAMGLAGAAIMFAVATGSALGGALLWLHPTAPFFAGAALAASIALAAPHVSELRVAAPRPAAPRRGFPRRLTSSIAAAFVSRFTIGCLVVTFALFAHRAHGLSDAAVGGLYALLTYPFALLTYPAARLTARVGRAPMLLGGGLVYGGALGALALAPTWALPICMLVAGAGSAALFAAILCHAASGTADERANGMAWVNAAGALGMLLGPAFAGILSAVLRARIGVETSHRVVIVAAAASIVLWAAPSLASLLARRRRRPQA